MSAFSVFGNPIKYSKSPQIYSYFAKEFGIFPLYTRMLAFWVNFDQILKDFFYLGGIGANITMPFKERACFLCDNLTLRASIAGSVNTIKKEMDGTLLGDNTDGVGLLSDLNRLNWLDNNNLKILILGAGGASRGVIHPLLNMGYQIEVVNRTLSRAQQLVYSHKHLGNISLATCDSKGIVESTIRYDLIINATSGIWVYDQHPILSPSLITSEVACYDMSYMIKDQNNNLTPFISWCKKHGAYRYSDGLGMLVGQAAHSFLLWHGVFPSVDLALNHLK